MDVESDCGIAWRNARLGKVGMNENTWRGNANDDFIVSLGIRENA